MFIRMFTFVDTLYVVTVPVHKRLFSRDYPQSSWNENYSGSLYSQQVKKEYSKARSSISKIHVCTIFQTAFHATFIPFLQQN